MIFSFDNSVIPTTFQTLWFLNKPSMNLTKAILYVMTFFFWHFKICLCLLAVWLWYVQVWLSLSLSYIKSCFLYLLLIRNLLIIISSNTLHASLFYLLVLRLTLYLQVTCLMASQRSLKLYFLNSFLFLNFENLNWSVFKFTIF